MRRPMLWVPTESFCCGMLSAFADGARRSISPVCVRVARGTFRSAFRVRHCCRFFVIVSSSRSLIFLPFRSLINAVLQKMSIFENAALVRGRAPFGIQIRALRFRRSISARTISVIASMTGTILGHRHASCRPSTDMSLSK